MASHLGFDSHMGNRLGYGAGDPFANQQYSNPNQGSRGYQDEQRRGHYLPSNARG